VENLHHPRHPLDSATLQTLLTYTGLDSAIKVEISDLAGTAVGSTQGSTITLDTTAAGYNWFIDPTPADNSEFLPTANPDVWIAKAGTEAAGKMDLLSVLLHEYGHALGIDHSANPNDFMATTLTAGVRRLPSAAEMALMQQLIAQAKTGVMAAQTSSNAATDQPNNTPLPIIPLGGFGIAFAGLLQRNRYGGVSIAADPSSVVTQYAVAANATLTNGSLNSGTGWATQGSVDIANGVATLNEVATRQTRLSQVFMLGANDRYLSFTLSGAALDNLPHPNPLPGGEGTNGTATGSGSSPSDAFEVALLNANTGASLLDNNGLTHSDAFLNLQADGTEHTSSGVIRILNAKYVQVKHGACMPSL
jgi:hypothetical protein